MTDPFAELLELESLNESNYQQESKETEVKNTTNQATVESTFFQKLPREQQAQAEQLAEQLNVQDRNAILSFGAQAQEKLGTFSQIMLENVQNQDLGPIGQTLSQLMYELEQSNPEELTQGKTSGWQKFFQKAKKSILENIGKYQQISAQVDKIAVRLEREQEGLQKDNQQLEQLYQKNKDFFQALTVYLAAGELKLYELETKDIPTLEKEIEATNDEMKIQELNDLTQAHHRLEKRMHDLKLARQITIQQAPQIRLIQNTNQALAEKIRSSITTAIPLWKNQIAIAITLLRQQNVTKTQQQVTETTNQLLKQNASMLKASTIEVAKENERSIVDIETLQYTQKELIDTIQQTLEIQTEGKKKRQEAEQTLGQLEEELKEQVLAVSKISHS